ncbi:hypothetical protein GCM10027321_15920 [Massilia terrae]|uniref:Uncharacterized protein n=1 Tax=Massilia terrae TaxID=1811224 RepID=A0ABT2D151_9BURK|nr:hypothetical protein [Massilia terrae]MCS0659973.1 hypothetical protein [Massilia terrae]
MDYGLAEIAGTASSYRWSDDYLGPEPRLQEIEAALASCDDLVVERLRGRSTLCERMLDLHGGHARPCPTGQYVRGWRRRGLAW